MAAACAAAQSGARVGVVDDNPGPGGQIWRGLPATGETPAHALPKQAEEWNARFSNANISMILGAKVFAHPEPGILAAETWEGSVVLSFRKTGSRHRRARTLLAVSRLDAARRNGRGRLAGAGEIRHAHSRRAGGDRGNGTALAGRGGLHAPRWRQDSPDRRAGAGKSRSPIRHEAFAAPGQSLAGCQAPRQASPVYRIEWEHGLLPPAARISWNGSKSRMAGKHSASRVTILPADFISSRTPNWPRCSVAGWTRLRARERIAGNVRGRNLSARANPPGSAGSKRRWWKVKLPATPPRRHRHARDSVSPLARFARGFAAALEETFALREELRAPGSAGDSGLPLRRCSAELA